MSRAGLPAMDPPSCDAVTEAVMQRLDRERVVLDEEALERHLLTCVRCRQRAREIQGVSRALKRWDAEVAARVEPPDRLRLEVVGAIAEVGRLRRRESRSVLVSRLAMAASVLLVLGAGLVAGRRDARRPVSAASPPRPPVFAARRPLPAIHTGPVAVAAAAPLVFAPSPLAGIEEPSGSGVTLFADEDRARLREILTRFEIAKRDRKAVERVCGGMAVAWADPEDWKRPEGRRYRWTSLAVVAYLQDRHGGAGSAVGWVEGLRHLESATADAYRYAHSGLKLTGRHVADVVRFDAAGPADGLIWRIPELHLDLRGFELGREPYAPQGTGTVLDLAAAYAAGAITFREGTDDDLVVLARGLTHPVYVPVGELIAGGSVDRVVAKPLWIRAIPGTESFSLACRPVSSPLPPGRTLRPVGLVAGPALRALLQSGASEGVVRRFVLDHAGGKSLRYSLLQAYDHPILRQRAHLEAASMQRHGMRAFLVTGQDGTLVGYEVALLPRPAAAALLGRLWMGYSIEAAGERPDDAEAAPEPRVGADALGALLRRNPPLATFDLRASILAVRTDEPEADVEVVGLTERASGHTLHASVLPAPR